MKPSPVVAERARRNPRACLVADETLHYTALTQALGAMLPSAALGFGA
jgi:hypothetical protein